jgi:hypothetical protein
VDGLNFDSDFGTAAAGIAFGMASTEEEEDAELTVDDVFNTIRYFASRTPGRDDPEASTCLC